MDIAFGSPEAFKFIGVVGIVSSNGPEGENIASCEWTRLISYKPGIISVSLHPIDATCKNIQATKEFAVALASTEQAKLSSISGATSGHDTDKIAVAKEFGFTFRPATKVKGLLIDGAALNLECQVYAEYPAGDHITFFANVVAAEVSDKSPLAYHQGMYWKLGENLPKPSDEERQKIKVSLASHHR